MIIIELTYLYHKDGVQRIRRTNLTLRERLQRRHTLYKENFSASGNIKKKIKFIHIENYESSLVL